MEFAEFFLDESETGGGRWLCVAGWIFSKEGSEALHEEWSALLCQYRLPYFHMGPCAHGNEPFKRFKRPERDQIQRRFFEVLTRRALVGFCATFDMTLARYCPTAIDRHGSRFHVTPYTLCCYWAFLLARNWANYTKYPGKIAYFFEAGHASQPQANRMMGEVFSNPKLREILRYGGHGFVEKNKSSAVQCADILAWQWGKNWKDRANGILKPRADLLALLRVIPCATIHFNEDVLAGFLREILAYAPDADNKAVSIKTIDSFWRTSVMVAVLPSYWSGRPPWGRLPH